MSLMGGYSKLRRQVYLHSEDEEGQDYASLFPFFVEFSSHHLNKELMMRCVPSLVLENAGGCVLGNAYYTLFCVPIAFIIIICLCCNFFVIFSSLALVYTLTLSLIFFSCSLSDSLYTY